MINQPLRYIIIDDDRATNFESTRIIKSVVSVASVRYFTNPQKGIEFMERDLSLTRLDIPTAILLDINMPEMTGWEVLERIKNFSQKIKNQVTVYILTSSPNLDDRDLARANPLVADYILKSLTKQKVQIIGYKVGLRQTG